MKGIIGKRVIVISRIVLKTAFRGHKNVQNQFFELRDAEGTGKKTGFNLMIVHFFISR